MLFVMYNAQYKMYLPEILIQVERDYLTYITIFGVNMEYIALDMA